MESLKALLASRPILILVIVLVALFIVALTHVLLDRKKTANEKLVWSLLIILMSGVAPAVYLIFGRHWGTALK